MNWLRKMVAQKKQTIRYEGYQLDLTYITKRVIAAGFPASGVASMWRNKRSTLIKFLQEKHGNMVKIYNLCAEKDFKYNSEHVGGLAVGSYPFRGHNVCSISKIAMFCMDAALFLQRMEQYTRDCHSSEIKGKTPAILVHCKAGKGRTGMMICSLLLFINMFPSAEKSIEHYDSTRVKDDKGLTISSQRRYVKFFEGFLNTELILRSDN